MVPVEATVFGTQAFQLTIRALADQALKGFSWEGEDDRYAAESPILRAILAAASDDCQLDWWRLKFIKEALTLLTVRGPMLDLDEFFAPGTRLALVQWLSADPRRTIYVNRAIAYVNGHRSLEALLEAGQAEEREAVYRTVLHTLYHWTLSKTHEGNA